MRVTWRRFAALGLTSAALAVVAAGCGGSSSSSTESTAGTGGSAAVPQIDAASFTSRLLAMAQLKDLAAQGKGMIGVLLPDTTTSARYVAVRRART